MPTKKILDPCCGSKMFWFDKNNQDAVFLDCRKEMIIAKDRSMKSGVQKISISPDFISSVEKIPFTDESFPLVVFDPPHLLNVGKNSWMAKKYGTLPKNWKPFIKNAFSECFRVLKTNGTLVFKWSEKDIKLSEVLKLIKFKPTIGSRDKKRGTKWIIFFKSNNGVHNA
ncbi:MAG: hypothetical protein WCR96_03310 [Candidatus Methanomethylophilaceae archaeon]|jgi:hypothetical protein